MIPQKLTKKHLCFPSTYDIVNKLRGSKLCKGGKT